MQLLPALTTLLLSVSTASALSSNANIICDTGAKDASLQSASAKKHMLQCVNALNKHLSPFQMGNFNGIRCGRDWNMFKKDGGSNYFKSNADCLKGCGSCLRLQAKEGRQMGGCTYYPDQKKWPSAFCQVGWSPLPNMVCSVQK